MRRLMAAFYLTLIRYASRYKLNVTRRYLDSNVGMIHIILNVMRSSKLKIIRLYISKDASRPARQTLSREPKSTRAGILNQLGRPRLTRA